MKTHTMFAATLVVLLMAAVISGCKNDDDDGGGGGSSGGDTAPTVVSTYPADGAATASLNTNIIARFSEPMNAATLNGSTFTVTGPGTTTVAGSVSYDAINYVADFLPNLDLAASTLFTATITTGAKDAQGAALASAYSWTFTTGTTTDSTPPTVTATSPDDLATGVPVNQQVTATFSEPMDSATVTVTSFTLMNGAASIAGDVSCPGTTATFIPAANLPVSTTITARVTTSATDLAGNAMVADHVWSFQTGTAVANGPAPVVLGTAGGFVILAKTTVTTTGTRNVVGDIGLSPGTSFTGFNETMDASGEFATAANVTGQMFKATYAPPTPSNLTTAILDMETAYDDAAGRLLPNALNLGGGNIQGMTLAPGLYKWGTGVSIPASVTLSGGPNDVWIFQISQDLTVGNGAIVTLTGGASEANIFWQVAGQVTLGTSSNFSGVVLCKTQIVISTSAIMVGRALAQTQVTLDSTDISQP